MIKETIMKVTPEKRFLSPKTFNVTFNGEVSKMKTLDIYIETSFKSGEQKIFIGGMKNV